MIEILKERFEEDFLQLISCKKSVYPATLFEPVLYAATSGGKRLRPVFLLLCAATVNKDIYEKAFPYAAALELIHTYSLVHDDLPCMDDDDFRRGKPTVHKAFDEATAVLTGDTLLNLAFETLLSVVPFDKRIAFFMIKNAGAEGMIGGQALDIGKVYSCEMITKKTAKLFEAAAYSGACVARATTAQQKVFANLGRLIGCGFQYLDNILDKEFADSSQEMLQKIVPKISSELQKIHYDTTLLQDFIENIFKEWWL